MKDEDEICHSAVGKKTLSALSTVSWKPFPRVFLNLLRAGVTDRGHRDSNTTLTN